MGRHIIRVVVAASMGIGLLAAAGQSSGQGTGAGSVLVYFGTYTSAKSEGIYVSRLDRATGALSEPQLAAGVVSPSFLAVHPNRGTPVGAAAGTR